MKRRSPSSQLFLFVLATIVGLGTGCSADSSPESPPKERGRTTDGGFAGTSDGDFPSNWEFTFLHALGDVDGPLSFADPGARAVGADRRGNVYVLDKTARVILVFDSLGNLTRQIGRKGSGPGELRWPIALSVAPDGEFAVYDAAKRAALHFSSEGKFLVETAIKSHDLVSLLAVTEEGLVVESIAYDRDSNSIRDRLLLMQPGGTYELATVTQPGAKVVEFRRCRITFPAVPLFSSGLVWTVGGGRVLVTRGSSYMIDVHVGTERVGSFGRDVAPRVVTGSMARKQLGEGLTVTWPGHRCRIRARDALRALGYAPVLPAVTDLSIGPEGTLWVKRAAVKGESAVIDLFSPEGAYLGTLPPGSPFPVAFLSDNRIVTLEEDEWGGWAVRIYRVNRPS